jgi:hypothetical protein
VAAVGARSLTVGDSVAVGLSAASNACNAGGTEPLGGVLSVDRSLSARNTVGVFVGPNRDLLVRVSNSTITDNLLFGMEAQRRSRDHEPGNNFVFNNAGGETFGATTRRNGARSARRLECEWGTPSPARPPIDFAADVSAA